MRRPRFGGAGAELGRAGRAKLVAGRRSGVAPVRWPNLVAGGRSGAGVLEGGAVVPQFDAGPVPGMAKWGWGA